MLSAFMLDVSSLISRPGAIFSETDATAVRPGTQC
jgi:hypothetical protein